MMYRGQYSLINLLKLFEKYKKKKKKKKSSVPQSASWHTNTNFVFTMLRHRTSFMHYLTPGADLNLFNHYLKIITYTNN